MAVSPTFIIGKRSNLSRALAACIPMAQRVASNELQTLSALLAATQSCNLVYNTYQKSTLLGQTDAPELYADYAFARLAAFVSICLKYRRHIDAIIFTSTSAVYGNNPHASEADKLDITNLYASVKLASEFFLRDYFKNTSIRLIIPRVFNMYGGYDEFSVVSKIARAALDGREIIVANDGRSVRDFIHISDVVEVYQRLLQSSCEGVVNVGTGGGVSVAQLVNLAEIAFDRRLATVPTKREEIACSVAATDALMRHVGPYSFKTVDVYYRDRARHKNGRELSE